MGGRQSVRDLHRNRQRLLDLDRAPLQPIEQRFAVEKLHDEKRGAVLGADIVQGANVRVCELRNRACLSVESVTELRVGGERRGEDLDRDRSIQPRITAAIHLAHAPSANQRQDFVSAEASSRSESHGRVVGVGGL